MASIPKKMQNRKSTFKSNTKLSAGIMAAKRRAAKAEKTQSKCQDDILIKDIYGCAINSRTVTRKDTGLVFDYSMIEHKCLWDPNYPECPERLSSVLERCKELNLVDRCKIIKSRLAEEEELLLQHSIKQIKLLKSTEEFTNVTELEKLSSKYDSIYIHPSTYKQSLNAVGSTVNLVTSICKGEVQNGMAIIRPPGHHAMKAEYCGYCFFNNVAIACQKVLDANLAERILIVDWDVHHGQATQQMFYEDPRVVYFSIHRYENGEFWPNLRESDFDFIGSNAGEGYNFNIPLNKIGMTNADYIAIFQQVLLPMAYEFQPDLIVVSAGYDAALGCPEGEMDITPACYSHLLWPLLALANGKVAVILEGGYCLESLSEGAALTLRALLGDPCPKLSSLEEPCHSIRETILNVIYTHKSYWKCFQFQELYSVESPGNHSENSNKRHLPTLCFRGHRIQPDKYETRNCYPVRSREEFDTMHNKLATLKLTTNLNKAQFKLCIVHDSRMLKHYDASNACHPEKPDRITNIYSMLQEFGILKRCLIIQGRMATEEELLLAHSKDYIDLIKETSSTNVSNLSEKFSVFNSVYINAGTWISARVSAGSLLQVVDNVLTNKSQSGIAVIRPPGHHAEQDSACGFCFFNNVAIAAKYAIKNHHVKRVLILDWDVHYGNGTQLIFEDDPQVLYISVHRYDNGTFFPSCKKGNYSYVGSGLGEGFTVNIPWNKKGMGDAEYIAAFQQVVMPIAYQFDPELILISAGFDACVGDPLGKCNVSPELYGHLTHWLSSLANGRVILTLEGGYNVNSISYAMTMCSKVLLGDPAVMLQSHQIPCANAITSITNVLKTHKKYWTNLKFQISLPKEEVLLDKELLRVQLEKKLSMDITEEEVLHSDSDLKGKENKVYLEVFNNEDVLDSVFPKEIQKLKDQLEEVKFTCEIDDKRNLNDEVHEFEAQINRKSVNLKKAKKGENWNKSKDESMNIEEADSCCEELQETNLHSFLKKNMQALLNEEMFAVVPKKNCSHLNSVSDVPKNGIDVNTPCKVCDSTTENWICLKCYTVHCARNINQHAILHEEDTSHPVALSFSDLSVWCYRCDDYIDNPALYAVRNAVHRSKFNEDLPWTYDEPTNN